MDYHSIWEYCNLLKKGSPSKISPPNFLNEVVAKGTFLPKARPPIYSVEQGKQSPLKKQCCAREGLRNERDIINLAVVAKACT